MSQRTVNLVEGEYYHIYNRGNSKQTIFKDRADYERFQQLLFGMNSHNTIVLRAIGVQRRFLFERGEPLVGIGAYCLMPNHFHILLTPLGEGGVENFMRKVSTGYSMYFNKKYERRGALFEGRYKSQYADTDEYLKYLFSYIHLNPLKLVQSDWKDVGLTNIVGGKNYLDKYRFSSYFDYAVGYRLESSILTVEKFPPYFPNRGSFLKDTTEWMNYKDMFQQ